MKPIHKALIIAGGYTLAQLGVSIAHPDPTPSPTSLVIKAGAVTYRGDPLPQGVVDGSEPCTYLKRDQDPNKEFYLYDRYVVEVRNSQDEAGAYFIVHFRPADAVPAKALDPVQWSKWGSRALGHAEDNDWFSGIQGNFLIVDQGCCPDPRGLEVYDLGTGKRVHSDSYCEPIAIEKGRLTYWEPTGKKAVKAECPDLDELSGTGSPPETDEKVSFDLKTLKLTYTGERRCSARQ